MSIVKFPTRHRMQVHAAKELVKQGEFAEKLLQQEIALKQQLNGIREQRERAIKSGQIL